MHIIPILSFALAIAASRESDLALETLAAQLKAARSSESVALTKCPASMESFIGLAQGSVVSKLGVPDLNQSGTGADGKEISVHQYLFAPPHAAWYGMAVSAGGWTAVQPLGDPFTVVQFHYDPAGVLLNAWCYDRA